MVGFEPGSPPVVPARAAPFCTNARSRVTRNDFSRGASRTSLQALSVAKRFQKFLIVGSFGLLVNQLMLVLLHDVGGIRLVVASPLAILASMAVTFVLNEMWTWHDREVVPSYIDWEPTFRSTPAGC